MPAAIREKCGAVMTTSGDVTMQHWMRACSYMAGQQWVLLIQTRELTIKHLRLVREWMQRSWAREVRLTIATDQRELVSAELEGLLDRVSIAIDADMRDECMTFAGDKGTVIIIGRVIAEMQPGLSLYAASYTKPGDEDEVYAAISSRHKLKKVVEETIHPAPIPAPDMGGELPSSGGGARGGGIKKGSTSKKKKSTTS